MSILDKLRQLTGRDDWEEVSGPESGVGTDFWFVNADQQTAYANLDQDHVKIQGPDDMVLFEGDHDEM